MGEPGLIVGILGGAAIAFASFGFGILWTRGASRSAPEAARSAEVEPVEVVSVQSAAALGAVLERLRAGTRGDALGDIAELFRRAFAHPDHPDADAALAFLVERLPDERIGVLLARRGDRWGGLAIVSGYTDAFSPHPWVAHFYAPGDRDLRVTLSRSIAAWLLERGHARALALNMTGHSDERWLAAHREVGAPDVVGSYAVIRVLQGGGA